MICDLISAPCAVLIGEFFLFAYDFSFRFAQEKSCDNTYCHSYISLKGYLLHHLLLLFKILKGYLLYKKILIILFYFIIYFLFCQVFLFMNFVLFII